MTTLTQRYAERVSRSIDEALKTLEKAQEDEEVSATYDRRRSQFKWITAQFKQAIESIKQES